MGFKNYNIYLLIFENMKVARFIFNDFSENTYVLYDETKECVIIDPGCYTNSEQNELRKFIQENGLNPVKLINTHCHIDHVLGNSFVANTFSVALYLHKEELLTYNNNFSLANMFGYSLDAIPDNLIYINEGDVLTFGNTTLKVLLTPGHSIASLSFYNDDEKILISGDVLFYLSIGRTDLPGGNFETLIQSIRTKLFTLPDETVVYSGHGNETTIGFEKQNNPFLV